MMTQQVTRYFYAIDIISDLHGNPIDQREFNSCWADTHSEALGIAMDRQNKIAQTQNVITKLYSPCRTREALGEKIFCIENDC